MLAAVSAAPAAEVGVRDEIFGSKEAAELVVQARAKRDRDAAVALYEEAIALQPGAPINAHLAATIARAYAHYADKKKGIRADPVRAATWWRRAIEWSNPRQFVWAEAQANLGCALFLTGDPRAAAERFQAVLEIDPAAMVLPRWKRRPSPDSPAAGKALEALRQRAAKARIKAVDNVHYVLSRLDGAEAAQALAGIAKQHQGTPVGEHARQVLAQAIQAPASRLYKYRGLGRALSEEIAQLLAQAPRGAPRREEAAPPPVSAPPTSVEAVAAPGPEAPSDAGPRSWWTRRGVAVACLLGATLVIMGVILTRRRVRKGDR